VTLTVYGQLHFSLGITIMEYLWKEKRMFPTIDAET
jgi:hypothetical protein